MSSKLSLIFRRSFREYNADELSLKRSLLSEAGADSPAGSSTQTQPLPHSYIDVVKSNALVFSIRGLDNVHIYMWILKDYSWSTDNKEMAIGFGSLALGWCVVLQLAAARQHDWEECYFLIGQILWLVGNFWWMCGETQIAGDDDTNAPQAAWILVSGLGVLLFYYLILRPCGAFLPNEELEQQLQLADMTPRFRFFGNWRQYEYMHTLCWICKDLAWNQLWDGFWWVALVPTVLVGCDFIHESYSKGYVVDTAHYSAQLLWVFANAAWAFGELYYPQYDESLPVTTAGGNSVHTGRWWASVLLLMAFVPILLLYFVWMPYVVWRAVDERFDKEGQLLDSAKAAAQVRAASSGPAASASVMDDGSRCGGLSLRHPDDEQTQAEAMQPKPMTLVDVPLDSPRAPAPQQQQSTLNALHADLEAEAMADTSGRGV